jgi:hypothetical protein
MLEREIDAKDIRVGDTIRLTYEYCGAKCTVEGVVQTCDSDAICLVGGLMYAPWRRDYKITLVNRPPTERTITPTDIRPGMWVRINGGPVGRVVNAALFVEEDEAGETEGTEFTLNAKDGSVFFVTLSEVVTAVALVADGV